MNIKHFLAWQWHDYGRNHRDSVNLAIHLVAVPMFIAGTILVPPSLLGAHFIWAAVGAALFAVSLVLQGWGHKREACAPAPFKSRKDFWVRLFTEQFITFPRFILSGRWLRREETGNAPR